MELVLRLCTEEDINIIYRMLNDYEVRMNSFNTNNISYEEHCKWYKAGLVNKSVIMYILEKGKVIIGQVRLEIYEDKAIISYSIEKNNRGKGYGKRILNLIKREAINKKILILEGLVKKDNIASRKAFIRNEFNEIEEQEYYRYTYLLK